MWRHAKVVQQYFLELNFLLYLDPGIFKNIFYVQYCIEMDSELDLRPWNLQLMPWSFQIQYSYILNRSSASNSLSEISGSAILFTNKCIRRRNIAFLQACELQISQLSIANENMRYIIIALESPIFMQ
jgi:hypothetical protein